MVSKKKPCLLPLLLGFVLVGLFGVAFFRLTQPRPGRPDRDSGQGTLGTSVERPTLPGTSAGHPSSAQAIARPEDTGWTVTGRVLCFRRETAESLTPSPSPSGGLPVRLTTRAGEAEPSGAQDAVTGPDGRFEFAGLPDDVRAEIRIDAPDLAYRLVETPLFDASGLRRRDMGDIVLERPSTLLVKLIGPDDEPVRGARITVRREHGLNGESSVYEREREAEETGEGEYVLERLPPRTHYLVVTASGYAPATRSIVLPLEEPLIVHMVHGRRIAGTVFALHRRPIEKAEIDIVGRDSDDTFKTMSDASGHFAAEGLQSREYQIRVSADGFAKVERADVPWGTEDLEVLLLPEAVFAGEVVAAGSGEPVLRARVLLDRERAGFSSSTAGPRSLNALTDGKGLFALRGVPPGEYRISATGDGFVPFRLGSLRIGLGDWITDQRIELAKGGEARFRINDSETQAPLGEASLYLSLNDQDGSSLSRWARAGPAGTIEVKGLETGEYRVSPQARAYLRPMDLTVSVGPGQNDFTLELERGASIRGRVLDADRKLVPGALVRAGAAFSSAKDEDEFRYTRSHTSGAETDEGGRFSVEGLPARAGYVVLATHPRHVASSVEGIDARRGEVVDGVEILLTRGGSIRCRVVDATGPVSRAVVFAEPEDPLKAGEGVPRLLLEREPSRYGVLTESDGTFVLSHIRAGSYAVTAFAQDHVRARREGIVVIDGRTTEGGLFHLTAGETLSGLVVDGDGSPIPGAEVRIEDDGHRRETLSDPEGRFRFSGLKPGTFDVEVEKPGFLPKRLKAPVPGDEVVPALDRSAWILGSVRAAGRDVVPQFDVQPRAVDGRADDRWSWRKLRWDNTGGFEIELSAGTYVIEARAPDYATGRSAEITAKAGERIEGTVIDLEHETGRE